MITITSEHRASWASLARNAYRNGRNALGHYFSVAAARSVMTDDEFNAVEFIFRRWLAFGEYPEAPPLLGPHMDRSQDESVPPTTKNRCQFCGRVTREPVEVAAEVSNAPLQMLVRITLDGEDSVSVERRVSDATYFALRAIEAALNEQRVPYAPMMTVEEVT